MAAILAGALAFDLAVQHPFGLTTFLAAAITAIAVQGSSDTATTPTARLLFVGSLLPAAMFIVRASPWLTWLNLAACAGMLLLAAAVRDEPRPIGHALGRLLRPSDVAFTLGAVLLVYGGFVASQVVALTAGDDYVRRTTGLTYAEYARSGFFQLLAAAVITLVILLGLVRLPGRPRPPPGAACCGWPRESSGSPCSS